MKTLHPAYRVRDLTRSADFYQKVGYREIGRVALADGSVLLMLNLPGDGEVVTLELVSDPRLDPLEPQREAVLGEETGRSRRGPAPARVLEEPVADLGLVALPVDVMEQAAALDLAGLAVDDEQRQEAALLEELRHLLAAQPFDVEGIAGNEMPKPLDLALFVRAYRREVKAPFPPAPLAG
jgi:catechol 2,3-dioxygenase-like lactoylglutathione lyase family enzyme